MSYKVIYPFTDLQDNNHPYKVGDNFPRLGLVVSEARLKQLAGENNKRGKALIEVVEDKELELPFVSVGAKYTKTEINRMPIAELKRVAAELGVEDVDNMNGAELKKVLIELFDL